MCGLDPLRLALTGAEMRACWTAPDPVPDEPPRRVAVGPGLPAMAPRGTAEEIAGRRPRTFVPVDELIASAEASFVADPAPTPAVPPTPAGRWSLWGDAEL